MEDTSSILHLCFLKYFCEEKPQLSCNIGNKKNIYIHERNIHFDWFIMAIYASVLSSCGRQKGPSMMTRYARSYSLQKGPSLEDSVE